MKKVFVLLMVLVSTSIMGQYYLQSEKPEKPKIYFSVSTGITFTNIDALKSSSSGLFIGIDIYNFYIEVSSNFAAGKGEYLNYESSKTYNAEKRVWYITNIGFDILIHELQNKRANFFLRPKVGYVEIDNIFNDPVAFDTYFNSEYERGFNLGLDSIFQIPENNLLVLIGAGFGSFEYLNIGVGFVF